MKQPVMYVCTAGSTISHTYQHSLLLNADSIEPDDVGVFHLHQGLVLPHQHTHFIDRDHLYRHINLPMDMEVCNIINLMLCSASNTYAHIRTYNMKICMHLCMHKYIR